MSLNKIKDKLIQSLKEELYTEENKEFIENDILKPMVHTILEQMYPYFLWMGLFFISMFIFILLILYLNLRVLL
tara:strand:- start:470 stop:691 length:222 start_codon:yes stop_codon:yes gene_type:complete